MEADCDATPTDHGISDLTIDAFAKESLEGGDHVGAASALVGVVIVTPTSIRREHPSERGEILGRERDAELVCDFLWCPCAEGKVEAAALVGVARDDPRALPDEASTAGAVHIHLHQRRTAAKT
jgi:hypothetical protein